MNPRQKRALRQTMRNNSHELYVVSFDEMDAIVRSSSHYEKVKERWATIRSPANDIAGYASSGSDSLILAKLIADLGSPSAKAVIKYYKGKPHIVLKGRPGLRKVLTGTRYGIQNPKVMKMGLGRSAATQLAKAGGVLTIVLLTGFRVIDHVLTDSSTLSRLIGSLATDVVKVGAAVGMSIAGAAIGGLFGVAVGPLVGAIFLGVVTSMALQGLDDHYEITEKVIEMLDELGSTPEKVLKAKKQQLDRALGRAVDTSFDYILKTGERLLANIARNTIDRLLRPRLR